MTNAEFMHKISTFDIHNNLVEWLFSDYVIMSHPDPWSFKVKRVKRLKGKCRDSMSKLENIRTSRNWTAGPDIDPHIEQTLDNSRL